MKRVFLVRVVIAAVCAVLVPALCGCNGQNDGLTNFLEIVQTILLGVTAAGSYAILRNV